MCVQGYERSKHAACIDMNYCSVLFYPSASLGQVLVLTESFMHLVSARMGTGSCLSNPGGFCSALKAFS